MYFYFSLPPIACPTNYTFPYHTIITQSPSVTSNATESESTIQLVAFQQACLMNEQLDSETISAFNQRDPRAFKTVFNLFYNELRYFAEKVIGNAEEAQDITAETFAKLFKKSEHFTTHLNIKAFLFITARNNCLDYLRHQKRIHTHQKDVYAQTMAWLSEEENYENSLIEAGVTAKLHAAIEQLPGECKKIFKLLYYEGMEQAEIAAHLGINVSTVRSQKSRAIQLLRDSLSKHEFSILLLLAFRQLMEN